MQAAVTIGNVLSVGALGDADGVRRMAEIIDREFAALHQLAGELFQEFERCLLILDPDPNQEEHSALAAGIIAKSRALLERARAAGIGGGR